MKKLLSFKKNKQIRITNNKMNKIIKNLRKFTIINSSKIWNDQNK